jgi:hypothetical protein
MNRQIIFVFILFTISLVILCGCTQTNPVPPIKTNSSIGSNENASKSNVTVSGNSFPNTTLSRYLDSDIKVSIDIPSNFIVDVLSTKEIQVRSPPRKLEPINGVYWLDNRGFIDYNYSNEPTPNISVSDILIDISIIGGYPTPTNYAEQSKNLEKYNPNYNITINDVLIGGIPAKQIIQELPGNPYWVRDVLMFNDQMYLISYGEYGVSNYNQKSDIVSNIIDSIKFIDQNNGTSEPGIIYVTARPTAV